MRRFFISIFCCFSCSLVPLSASDNQISISGVILSQVHVATTIDKKYQSISLHTNSTSGSTVTLSSVFNSSIDIINPRGSVQSLPMTHYLWNEPLQLARVMDLPSQTTTLRVQIRTN